MIKIKELRQGSLVMLKGEVISWDWALIADGINTLFKRDGSEVMIDPLPIDLEWLDRFCFENDGGHEWVIELQDYVFIMEYFEYTKAWHYTAGHGTRSGIGCKFVHELQNLCFVITGEELTVKETP